MSSPLAHEAMRLTIGRLDDGDGGEVLTVEAETSHCNDDGVVTWRLAAQEGGVRPRELGVKVAELFTRYALALLLAVALPALAGDWPKSASDPSRPAAACKRQDGEGLVPCCGDVEGKMECGWEPSPPPATPKAPIRPGPRNGG